jgi:hypothetical protein
MLSICTNCENSSTLLPVWRRAFEQFEQRLGLAAGAVVADELRMAADLAQARERGEDVHLALR